MIFLKGLIGMKSRIITAVAVVALIGFFAMIACAMVAYPMHIGEPSYYHVARVNCLKAAIVCAINFLVVLILCR